MYPSHKDLEYKVDLTWKHRNYHLERGDKEKLKPGVHYINDERVVPRPLPALPTTK